MPPVCEACGVPLPEGANFCPQCRKAVSAGGGTAVAPAPRTISVPGYVLPGNFAGMLAYFFVPAIVFLLLEPYKRDPFVRFHSFQALFSAAASFVMLMALMAVGMIPGLALVVLLALIVLFFGALILMAVLLIKAFQGETYQLPYIGNFASKQANAL